jgi:pilus assembly protein CpaF
MSNALLNSPFFTSLIQVVARESEAGSTSDHVEMIVADRELVTATLEDLLPEGIFADESVDTNPSIPLAYEMQRLLDWKVIGTLRKQVAEILASAVQAEGYMSAEALEASARVHINEVVRSYVEDTVRTVGQAEAWKPAMQMAAARALFDALFRLGRIQPLLDLPNVENIDINGCDPVWVSFADGSSAQYDPVAATDEEFVADIQFLASRGGEGGRSWSAASPRLDMDLPGNARLAAVLTPNASRPTVVIRVHRLVNITLDDLVNIHQTMPRAAADYLKRAVLAGKSIVVSGPAGAGKTTLTRALANCLPREVKIVTIEKERELHLDRFPGHDIVKSLQYSPGSGERFPDGSRAGEVSLVDLLESALRLDAQRIIVGEVRGKEINAMFQAMQAGVGSFSTIHASSALNAIERMATLMLTNEGVTDDYAYRQIANHIDVIVQVEEIRPEGQPKRRLVTEIAEVVESDKHSRPTIRPVFMINDANVLAVM